jgi:hypothetical protein
MQGSAHMIVAAAPLLAVWLQWVFAVLGGQMIAVGALLLPIAWRARGEALSVVESTGLVIAAGASAVVMSVTNVAIHSDFRWLLTVPVFLWIVALSAVNARKAE